MKKTFLTSAVIAIGILIWLMSGVLTEPDVEYAASLAEQNTIASQVEFEAPPTKVRVQHLTATQQTRFTASVVSVGACSWMVLKIRGDT